jgi:glutamate-ammonia-ligase adenylyltransferase
MRGAALAEEVEHSPDPGAVGVALARLGESRPGVPERLEADDELRRAFVAVAAASPHLTRLVISDPMALDVLDSIQRLVPSIDEWPSTTTDTDRPAAVARWKRLALLRIAARDLLGLDGLEQVGAALADLADDVLGAACQAAGLTEGLAVIGMGKLGGRELNYASDIDVLLVGDGDGLAVLNAARLAWRVDADLRPEGRSGPLVRSLPSYEAYWDRWAHTWEFQALLKARPVAGDPALGAAFATAAATRVWGRPFGAEELRAVRQMKARSEGEIARRGLTERELKRGRGGIRDIEFAVQLLQLVHGRADAGLRSPNTLAALSELASAGYIAPADGAALAEAYRFLRTAEHRLQLVEDQPVYAVPADRPARTRLARVMGFRDDSSTTALEHFDAELGRHQATARSIHERLFFRPLLEAFSQARTSLAPEAVVERLAAFGFSDAERTRQAVTGLTKGFSRSSRLMQELLPILLEWLSESPDPDLGLLGLRTLTTGQHQRSQLTNLFRESPEAARKLCLLLGTSELLGRRLARRPDVVADLLDERRLRALSREDLATSARHALSFRTGLDERRHALVQLQRSEWLRIAVRHVLGLADVGETGRSLTDLAEVILEEAVASVAPPVPMAIVAMGRFGGAELSYSSDLGVLVVFEGEPSDRVEEAAEHLLRFVKGDTPAERLYTLDADLRPEGRQGPLARSVDAFAGYYERWAQVWERQALLRARVAAGDRAVGDRFLAVAREFVWDRPFGEHEAREIRRMKARIERERMPAGEDPQFNLKLGRGSLSDVEWTAQLLQLRHGVAATGTLAALDALEAAGALGPEDAAILSDAYRFCEETRNRWFLVRGGPGDSLPATGTRLTTLARSLGTTASELRDEYRRRTRRSRQVMERLFYDIDATAPRAGRASHPKG